MVIVLANFLCSVFWLPTCQPRLDTDSSPGGCQPPARLFNLNYMLELLNTVILGFRFFLSSDATKIYPSITAFEISVTTLNKVPVLICRFKLTNRS